MRIGRLNAPTSPHEIQVLGVCVRWTRMLGKRERPAKGRGPSISVPGFGWDRSSSFAFLVATLLSTSIVLSPRSKTRASPWHATPPPHSRSSLASLHAARHT